MKNEKFIIGDDSICPITKRHCDDECCPTGSECNLSGIDLISNSSSHIDVLKEELDEMCKIDDKEKVEDNKKE
jgi:hypothetical protein